MTEFGFEFGFATALLCHAASHRAAASAPEQAGNSSDSVPTISLHTSWINHHTFTLVALLLHPPHTHTHTHTAPMQPVPYLVSHTARHLQWLRKRSTCHVSPRSKHRVITGLLVVVVLIVMVVVVVVHVVAVVLVLGSRLCAAVVRPECRWGVGLAVRDVATVRPIITAIIVIVIVVVDAAVKAVATLVSV